MIPQKRILIAITLTLLVSLTSCSGNGKPSNREITDALERALSFEIRKQAGKPGGEIHVKVDESKDCIEHAGLWRCHVSGSFEATSSENQKVSDTFDGDITLKKVDNTWQVEDMP